MFDLWKCYLTDQTHASMLKWTLNDGDNDKLWTKKKHLFIASNVCRDIRCYNETVNLKNEPEGRRLRLEKVMWQYENHNLS